MSTFFTKALFGKPLFLLTFFSCALVTIGSAQMPCLTLDMQKKYKKNKVTQVIEYNNDFSQILSETNFDKLGRISFYWNPACCGRDTIKTYYQYDEESRVILEKKIGMKKYPVEHIYQYDKTGKIIKEYSSAEPRDFSFKYDSKKRVIEKYGRTAFPVIGDDGNPTKQVEWNTIMITYTYDHKNRVIEEQTFVNGSLEDHYIYEFDKKGFLTSERYFLSQESKPMHIKKYKYNSKGLLYMVSKIDVDGYETITRFDTWSQ
jgi:hypothetical protein